MISWVPSQLTFSCGTHYIFIGVSGDSWQPKYTPSYFSTFLPNLVAKSNFCFFLLHFIRTGLFKRASLQFHPFRKAGIDVETKPLHPTSTRKILIFTSLSTLPFFFCWLLRNLLSFPNICHLGGCVACLTNCIAAISGGSTIPDFPSWHPFAIPGQ